jgi:hypothetical protein
VFVMPCVFPSKTSCKEALKKQNKLEEDDDILLMKIKCFTESICYWRRRRKGEEELLEERIRMRICSKYKQLKYIYTVWEYLRSTRSTWRNPTSAGPRADLHSTRAALWSTHAQHMASRPRTQKPD